jgi:hypothetical protein
VVAHSNEINVFFENRILLFASNLFDSAPPQEHRSRLKYQTSYPSSSRLVIPGLTVFSNISPSALPIYPQGVPVEKSSAT